MGGDRRVAAECREHDQAATCRCRRAVLATLLVQPHAGAFSASLPPPLSSSLQRGIHPTSRSADSTSPIFAVRKANAKGNWV